MRADDDNVAPNESPANRRRKGILPEQDLGDPVPYAAALESDRQRLFSLLNELPGIVYLRGPDYTIHFANRQFKARFGEPSAEPCYKLIHDRQAPCEPCGCATALAEGQLLESEWVFPDGSSYQLYDYPLLDLDGDEKVLHLGIDITKRKQAEAELERANRELMALSQMEHRERLLAENLAQAALALNSSLDSAQVIDRILEQTLRVVPCTAAMVMLVENQQVQLAGQHGLESSPSADLGYLRIGVSLDGVPLLQDACSQRQAVTIQDTKEDPRARLLSHHKWIRSLAALPMIQDDSVVGFIVLLSDRTGFFTREVLLRLESFASHAALAIENARLYQDGLEAARTAEFLSAASLSLTQTLDLDEVLDNLMDLLIYLVPYEAGRVSVLADGLRLVPRVSRGEEDAEGSGLLAPLAVDPERNSLLAEPLRTGESLWIAATEQEPFWEPHPGFEPASSYMAVPLITHGRVIGLCELQKQGIEQFTQQHLWWAEALSGQASVAIHNARLYEATKESREQLQSLSRRLAEVQENERRHVARELHDEAGQALTSLMIQLKLLQRNAADPDQVRTGITGLIGEVESVMAGLHRLAMDLRPASLDHLGLVAALDQYCQTLAQQHTLQVTFDAVGIRGRVAADVETALYRIVQEALNNVVRHAEATRVDVLLEGRGDRIVVIIEDDGLGFDPAIVPGPDHLGLVGIQERSVAIGGTLTIESTPDGGTTLFVEVPNAYPDPDCR